jgi:hypothetical protein
MFLNRTNKLKDVVWFVLKNYLCKNIFGRVTFENIA